MERVSTSAPVKLRIGILFGGSSREREIAFAGGRTVYDNLDKRLFEPVPIFVDSLGRFIRLDWRFLYKGTIRDFYPPAGHIPAELSGYQVYAEHLGDLPAKALDDMAAAVGETWPPEQLTQEIDLAFLALHGADGEDGRIQGMLEYLRIPYTGAGLLGAALGIDKLRQRPFLEDAGFEVPPWTRFALTDEDLPTQAEHLQAVIEAGPGFPCVLKHPTQGSSIGVSIVHQAETLPEALARVSFRQIVNPETFRQQSPSNQQAWVQRLLDIRSGLGLPCWAFSAGAWQWLAHPASLQDLLVNATEDVVLQAPDAPDNVLIEAFVDGTEFSVITIEDAAGNPLALPPTEILKQTELYDYRSKYLPGMARKRTPIQLPEEDVRRICSEAERLMAALQIDVYARLDGILSPDGRIFFNDPNTTSGMLPGSFFFHQAAEVGLTPSSFLTYLIDRSLAARARQLPSTPQMARLRSELNHLLQQNAAQATDATPVAVVMGGYSAERHISMESGRNVFEKLNASEGYHPTPLFLMANDRLPDSLKDLLPDGTQPPFSLWELPIQMMLKDNADDIAEQVVAALKQTKRNPIVAGIDEQVAAFTAPYGRREQWQPRHVSWTELAESFEAVFLALHGRPGEDGTFQEILDQLGLPYNGSGPDAARLAMDKHATNACLRKAGFRVAEQREVRKEAWASDQHELLAALAEQFGFPLIAKPADDGCSAAVRRLDDAGALAAYLRTAFREDNAIPAADIERLRIQPSEDFPPHERVLIERYIQAPAGYRQIEVTVGFLTHATPEGPRYEIFEPSEALAAGTVLSLEEKFLAGEGQNVTPARFDPDPTRQQAIAEHVRAQVAQAVQTLGAEGYGRMDAFVAIPPADGRLPLVTFIELNSLPGVTPATAIFHQCALAGYTPASFIDAILQYGRARRPRASAPAS